jgi:hypothetical protein
MTDCTAIDAPNFANCGCQCNRLVVDAQGSLITADANCVAEYGEGYTFDSSSCGCKCNIVCDETWQYADTNSCTCEEKTHYSGALKGIGCSWCACGQTDTNRPSIDWANNGASKELSGDVCASVTGETYPLIRNICLDVDEPNGNNFLFWPVIAN